MAYNRNYGVLSDGMLTYAPHPLVIDGNDVITNDSSVFLAQGYKPIILTVEPIEAGYIAVSMWVESETAITQTWTLEPLPEQEDLGEIIDILTGEVE